MENVSGNPIMDIFCTKNKLTNFKICFLQTWHCCRGLRKVTAKTSEGKSRCIAIIAKRTAQFWYSCSKRIAKERKSITPSQYNFSHPQTSQKNFSFCVEPYFSITFGNQLKTDEIIIIFLHVSPLLQNFLLIGSAGEFMVLEVGWTIISHQWENFLIFFHNYSMKGALAVYLHRLKMLWLTY